MAAKNRKSDLPGDSAGKMGLEAVDKILAHMHPNMEPGEAIAHITRELKGFVQILGKDKLKELIDTLDAGDPQLSPRVDLAKMDTEKVGGGVGMG